MICNKIGSIKLTYRKKTSVDRTCSEKSHGPWNHHGTHHENVWSHFPRPQEWGFLTLPQHRGRILNGAIFRWVKVTSGTLNLRIFFFFELVAGWFSPPWGPGRPWHDGFFAYSKIHLKIHDLVTVRNWQPWHMKDEHLAALFKLSVKPYA